MEKHSHEIQDILSKPPRFIVQYGTLAAVLAFFALMVVMYFIQYPSKVDGRLRMTTKMPPMPVVAPMPGYVKMTVNEGEYVERGQELGVIEGRASSQDITRLEELVIKLKDYTGQDYRDYATYDLRLGSVQAAYNELNNAIFDYTLAKRFTNLGNKKNSFNRQIENQKASIAFLDTEIKKLQEELRIARDSKEKKQRELRKGIIGYEEYNDYMARIKEIEGEISNRKSNREVIKSQIASYEFEIKEETLNRTRSKSAQYQYIQKKLEELDDAIDQWKSLHVLKSPTNGTITFYDTEVSRKYVSQNNEVMAVVPRYAENEIIGEVKLPLVGSGAVEKGQRVLVKYDTYPFLEYGYVEGIVERKSLLPTPGKEEYNLEISFPKGLKTSRGDTIHFRQNMLANAEIITEDTRLMKRLLGTVLRMNH